jgi:hypothetical protein
MWPVQTMLLLAGLVAASPSAESTPAPTASADDLSPHAGWYAGLSVGFGIGWGTYHAAIPAYSNWNGSFDGAAMDIGGAFGYGVLPGLAVALEAGVLAQPDVDDHQDPLNRTKSLVVARVGVLADGFVTSSFHLQGGVDWIRGSWSALAWVQDETPTGLLAHGSAGLAWRVFGCDLGPALRVYYAGLSSDNSGAAVVGITGIVNAVWF